MEALAPTDLHLSDSSSNHPLSAVWNFVGAVFIVTTWRLMEGGTTDTRRADPGMLHSHMTPNHLSQGGPVPPTSCVTSQHPMGHL